MRLQQLNLIRYGKFTDVDVALPGSEYDFHFIIGPNEAGKSTLRSAIAELLFGFPVRSGSMAFLHLQNELRLGASVAGDAGELAFHRLKANKNTLRNLADAPLPDDVLVPYLGAADRLFFEQMFGLGHEQLVDGGRAILDASKDVSQVIFQSAAGIASLGKVRDALAAEADSLWAPKASAGRSYYAAQTLLEAASKELKEATVRPKAWGEARDSLAKVEERVLAENEGKRTLDAKRTKLDRVRRLAPSARKLRDNEAALGQLGAVLDFHEDASQTLSDGQETLALAKLAVEQRESEIQRLAEQRDAISYDEAVMASKGEIEELGNFAQRVRDHYTDLEKRKAEVLQYEGLARSAAAELGWPQGELAEIRRRLPDVLALRALQRLVTSRGKLQLAHINAERAVVTRQREIDLARRELESLAVSVVSSSLRSALSDAQPFKNWAARHGTLVSAASGADRALSEALGRLGRWQRDVEQLRQMTVPSTARLTGLVAERQRLAAALETAREREVEARERLANEGLRAKQFQRDGVVTGTQVKESRVSRDTLWSSIKDRVTPLDVGAVALDSAIALADRLVDSQLGAVSDAAKLQELLRQMELAEAEVGQRVDAVKAKVRDLDIFESEWREEVKGLLLVGLDLADAQAWFEARDHALDAAFSFGEANEALARETKEADEAFDALRSELHQAGVAVAPDGRSAALLAEAERFLAKVDASTSRGELLASQIDSAERSLGSLKEAASEALAAFQEWEASWNDAVEAVGLRSYIASVEDAEDAISKVSSIRANLEKAAETQTQRVDSMMSDLENFSGIAKALVIKLEHKALDGADARVVSTTLADHLQRANAAFLRRSQVEESLLAAKNLLEMDKQNEERARTKLAPLLALAGVDKPADAIPLVRRSDQKRALEGAIQQEREALLSDADGLTFDEVLREIDECDFAQLPADIEATKTALEACDGRLTQLAEERLKAEQAFQAIDGGANAAVAESRRQEALAEMADAAERYIKVQTASKLLTWAIDQYRERKQGPMLARATAIFSSLTLGNFSKLHVDYSKTSPTLSALRAVSQGGELARQLVDVEGMSEGTRDQLFLALRLAALELHLEKSKALPFIADDLFVNFDDARSKAGLEVLRELSAKTQVLFLSHHEHLLPMVNQVFGEKVNVVRL